MASDILILERLRNMLVLSLAMLSSLQVLSQQATVDSVMAAVAEAAHTQDNRQKLAAYCAANPDDGLPSVAGGTVSKGSLSHGKRIPFQGSNFLYYDTLSYLDDRAYVYDRVKTAVVGAYQELAISHPSRWFVIMECSKKNGGKIWPHRTHQNGLSIDFMVPMVQDGKPFYGLDTLGFPHYLLEFNNDGTYPPVPGAAIDLNLIATHLLVLQRNARKQGLEIAKVLLKVEFLDELFKTPEGAKLKTSGIYFPTQLEPLINGLHDNHYHVDFKVSPAAH